MGQYYRALIIKEKTLRKTNKYGIMDSPNCKAISMNPFDYNNTYKLMEWSYIGNEFLDTVLSQLKRPLHDKRKRLLAFVGDYSEFEEHMTIPDELNDYRYEIRDAHDAVWNRYGEKAMREKSLERTLDLHRDVRKWYAIDRTGMEFVKLFDLPNALKDWDGKINPVGILCATSNGMGGGDYYGVNADMAGRWAFHDIVVTYVEPSSDYKEIKPDFKEE